jgi:phospholipase C
MAILCLIFSGAAHAVPGQHFDRAIFVLFENTNYSKAIRQPFFKELADKGAHFTNFKAETHPSQPNYIALAAGDTHGVRSNGNVNLNVASIVDLLEAKGLTWKAYAEDYPGNCFRGGSYRNYARKHNPFISFVNVQSNPARCGKIVPAAEFEQDVAAGTLPNYVFYIPNGKNDGHDTGVAYADRWFRGKFESLVNNPNFMNRTVLIPTFDEGSGGSSNQVYTSIVGPSVIPGTMVGDLQNHYTLLRMIEDNWNLGTLGLRDASAPLVPDIWQ